MKGTTTHPPIIEFPKLWISPVKALWLKEKLQISEFCCVVSLGTDPDIKGYCWLKVGIEEAGFTYLCNHLLQL